MTITTMIMTTTIITTASAHPAIPTGRTMMHR